MKSLQKLISKKFTLEVLLDIIRRKTGFSNAVVKKITLGDATNSKKGESYMSAVTRFTVEVNSGNKREGDHNEYVHLIAKGLPSNMARRSTFRAEDFFRNEIAFYNKVWPAMDSFQKSKNLKTPINVVPECLASFRDGAHDYVVFEDLSYKGYSSITRNVYLNFDVAAELIREIGRFHALSIGLKDEKPDEFFEVGPLLEETNFTEEFRNWYTPVMEKMLWILRDAVAKELPKEYVDKYDELLKLDLFGELVKICEDRSDLCGIQHGDFWLPNFLIKYNENCKLDIKFIDYQVSRCANVVMDLTFFLYTCVEPSVCKERWNDLIQIYADTVSNFLGELNLHENLISVDKINDSMRRIGLFTFVMGADAVIMSSLEEEDVVDMDEIQEVTTLDKVWVLNLITSEGRRKRAAGFFKHLVDYEFI